MSYSADNAADSTPVVRVAVPVPVYRAFDYLAHDDDAPVTVGARVRVRFGQRLLVGIVLETDAMSTLERGKLRPVAGVVDHTPIFDADLLGLLCWAARYYHYPIGEALATALPTALRRTAAKPGQARHRGWQARAVPAADIQRVLARAPKQRRLFDAIRAGNQPVAQARLRAAFGAVAGALQALERRGLIQARTVAAGLEHGHAGSPPALTAEQHKALADLRAGAAGFAPTLVDGVTGSGKTEIYFQRMADALAAGCQVLFLAPEIGLTPQLVERVCARFSAAVGVLHSGRGDAERADVWRAAAAGAADIVIGTRSAVFTPLPRLGLIVVDEEHDGSYKQQDGFRYHARDVALVRAQRAGIPILLGSATPALETLYNAQRRRYRHVYLPRRATGAALPAIRLLDVRARKLAGGLCEPLLARIDAHLASGNQAMVFINRRGYAPALCCHDCGWIAPCARCDAPLTVHGGGARLVCHHCGASARAPAACPACGAADLIALGAGTERVAGALRSRFPDVAIARFDRDSMAGKGRMNARLADVASGATQLLVGTQMLAKGHDFARLTCVGVLAVDGGLFSADFRAAEHMAQLVTQVAGRAGRADRAGEVWLQTHHPEHPLLQRLLAGGYADFARAVLAERRDAKLPPFGYLALLRAEAPGQAAPFDFLAAARRAAGPDSQSLCLGPVPALMARRAGRYRAQLLVHALRRAALHGVLARWQRRLPELPGARRVRWSIDVDPQDIF